MPCFQHAVKCGFSFQPNYSVQSPGTSSASRMTAARRRNDIAGESHNSISDPFTRVECKSNKSQALLSEL